MITTTIDVHTEITSCQIPAPGYYRERWIDHDLDDAAADGERIKRLAWSIASGWDRSEPVMLLDLEDGDYAVINGRHRILAARLACEEIGGSSQMPVIIVTEEEWEQMPTFKNLDDAEGYIRRELDL